VEFLRGVARVRATTPTGLVTETVDYGRAKAGDVLAATAEVLAQVLARALASSRSFDDKRRSAADALAAKALQLSEDVREVISDRQVRVTATAATGGAIVLGTGGGAAGMLAGSALGAAWGLLPALLTFGLSIPFCATVCGGAGLCAGAALGGAAGLVGGAAAGYALNEDKDGLVDHLLRGRAQGLRRSKACVGGTGGTA